MPGYPLLFLGRGYTACLERAGALPLLLPPTADPRTLSLTLDRVDGLVIAGGERPVRVDPGAPPSLAATALERHAFELRLIGLAMQRRLPLLGICRGHQMINEHCGGTLYTSLAADLPEAMDHNRRDLDPSAAAHRVTVVRSSIVGRAARTPWVEVNSLHQQAVCRPGPTLRVTARAGDGVIEAVEGRRHPFCVGLQFHPELMADNMFSTRLFRALVRAARRHYEARRRAAAVGSPR